MEDLISAISTARGVGGVAIIRLSGENVINLIRKIFRPFEKIDIADFEPYKLYVGEIDGGSFFDYGMCVFFKAPKSYTGEDMFELHCHGGKAITDGILNQTFLLGAKPANAGEFTKRAFMNGKLSLSSCEGLIHMINSETEAEAKAGYSLYREKLNTKVRVMQAKLKEILASIDADIDFPEEDLEQFDKTLITEKLGALILEIQELLDTYKTGEKVRDGVSVAILGKPNTGKSSLLNAILNYERAIVSDIAGTTRDVVDGSLIFNGIKYTFFDTAGIREGKDSIEILGIERSKKILKTCDIALLVLDSSDNLTDEDKLVLDSIQTVKHIIINNKSDKKQVNNFVADISISTKTFENIDKLKQMIEDLVFENGLNIDDSLLLEQRHNNALKNALESLKIVEEGLKTAPLDLMTIDLTRGYEFLGEITGETASEDIITEIFSKFCVGK